MGAPLLCYQCALSVLVWRLFRLLSAWPSAHARLPPPSWPHHATPPACQRPHTVCRPAAATTLGPVCPRSPAAHGTPAVYHPPPCPRRPRTGAPSRHFWPHTGWRYRGWLERGNLRANGHPRGAPGRQGHGTAGPGDFPEPHGTIFHGLQAAAELIVRMLAGLAEGLRLRAPARVFAVAPKPVLHGRVAAAAQLKAFSRSFLGEGHVPQSPGNQGRSTHAGHGPARRAAGAGGARAGRPPAGGDRRGQGGPERAAEPWRRLGAACAPPGYRPGAHAALAAPARAALCAGHQNDAAPAPGTRQSPGGRRDVCGAAAGAGRLGLAAQDGRRGTSPPHHPAAWGGDRPTPLCPGPGGRGPGPAPGRVPRLRQRLPAPWERVRQPLPQPVPPPRTGSAKPWRPGTPAMAAGVTAHGWTLPAVRLYRGPPWPQPQTGEKPAAG